MQERNKPTQRDQGYHWLRKRSDAVSDVLVCSQTPGADIETLPASANSQAHAVHVGSPHPLRMTVGVANAMPKPGHLAAQGTLGHAIGRPFHEKEGVPFDGHRPSSVESKT